MRGIHHPPLDKIHAIFSIIKQTISPCAVKEQPQTTIKTELETNPRGIIHKIKRGIESKNQK